MHNTNKNLRTRLDLNNSGNPDDEFYTPRDHVENILKRLKKADLKDKVVYLPWDNPDWSYFYIVLKEQYEKFHYKKLVSTFLAQDEEEAFITVFDGAEETRTPLEDNGDFFKRDKELQEADVVIGNPPFSTKLKMVKKLDEYDLDFLLLLPNTVIKNTFIYKMIAEGKYRCYHNKQKYFIRPDGELKEVDTFLLCCGITPQKDYKYGGDYKPVYCNPLTVDGIKQEVLYIAKVGDVYRYHMDYPGLMAVPITMAKDFDYDKFEIIYYNTYSNENRIKVDGKDKFARILIRNKNPQKTC